MSIAVNLLSNGKLSNHLIAAVPSKAPVAKCDRTLSEGDQGIDEAGSVFTQTSVYCAMKLFQHGVCAARVDFTNELHLPRR